ncbi:hypothetical protein ONZ45_g14451 [Pleurotus djamor]|nr:hypothetical protein ONZ45_g14451 [Pleurotus djamor]
MHDIWAEHLPHLHSKQVSIGADEYASSLADDYLRFVANMSDFIRDISGGVKSIRSWGTFEPSDDLTLTKGTTVQHWDGGQDNALELLEQGYNLINSEDAFLYIVMKQSGGFPQKLDQNHLWTGNEQGGPWDPTKFNRQATTLSAPALLGGIMAIWSDQGPTASTPLEAFYSLKMGLPFVVATSWHSVNRTQTMLTREQFDQVFPVLEASAPGQNLDRRVKINGVVVGERVVSFDFGKSGVKDVSGNGFDAKLSKGATLTNDGIVLKDGAHIATPLGSKGANYTLSLNFKTQFPLPPNSPSASLLTGPDTALLLVPTQNGSTTLAFLSSNVTYPLNNFVFPNSASRAVHLVIQGTEDETTAFVDGTSVGGFETLIRRIEQFRPMGFVAPLSQIGGPGFTGTISGFRVLDGLRAP